ncbi:integrase catalytic domain-containing protein [Trichonephila clavata]|uniref:Integrase catalytic domain-containing protein n=1 Tax=Trichonephila clavata TaxID=2740835 RepID=A0A8X6FLG2_TRICU|nr:integrase catalytic domain-containing protein [Trichonephila clavata]
MAKGVKSLERKFSDIEKQLSGFIAFVDTFVEDDKEVLSFKLSQFDRLNAKYESVKEEIFTFLSDGEFNNFGGKITTCNEHIEKLEVRLKSLNLKYSKNNNETGSNAVSNVIKPCFRLPEFSLPQFNGDIETWFIFKEQFKEIIENCGLNDKQKLQYLQSCLIGIAKHVQTVDDTNDSLFLALEQRFRKYVVAFSSDIKELFRQIKVQEHQQDFLRILWSPSPEEDIVSYRLQTVTYGTKPAPYLATRCLLQLAHEGKNKYPLATPVIQNSTYMDDILSGADDITTSKEMQRQLIGLMKEGCFHLYKWSANSEELLKDVPTENKEFLFNENDELVKTLGLSWRPREDTFMYRMNLQEVPVTITKRTALSFISKLYDPLGLLQPIIIKAKMMIQKIWLLKIDWDQNLPRQEIENFQRYVAELHQLKDLKIPRCILLKDSVAVQLTGFADASAQAYGACLYVKSENANETQIRLLCSKTRVAPLKTLSIPRFELLAATLLSKLTSKIVKIIDLEFDEVHLFSDSKVVLEWIQIQLHLLKVFVV